MGKVPVQWWEQIFTDITDKFFPRWQFYFDNLFFFIPNPFTNQKRLEEEKKLKKKMKKKEREERLKKEGKFLTEKQKQDKRRLEQMLAAMKEAGKLSFPPSPPFLSAYYSKKFSSFQRLNTILLRTTRDIAVVILW